MSSSSEIGSENENNSLENSSQEAGPGRGQQSERLQNIPHVKQEDSREATRSTDNRDRNIKQERTSSRQLEDETEESDLEEGSSGSQQSAEDSDEEGFGGLDDRVQIVRNPLLDEADDEELEEDKGSNEGGDSQDENNSRGKWRSKEKKTRKTCRHFSYDLIDRAVRYAWEPEQLSELLFLVIKELDLDLPQIQKMIEKTRIGSPVLLSRLADLNYQFSVSEMASILLNSSDSIQDYIRFVDEALGMELIQAEIIDDLFTVRKRTVYLSSYNCIHCSVLFFLFLLLLII
jgi:hypothetical protein